MVTCQHLISSTVAGMFDRPKEDSNGRKDERQSLYEVNAHSICMLKGFSFAASRKRHASHRKTSLLPASLHIYISHHREEMHQQLQSHMPRKCNPSSHPLLHPLRCTRAANKVVSRSTRMRDRTSILAVGVEDNTVGTRRAYKITSTSTSPQHSL